MPHIGTLLCTIFETFVIFIHYLNVPVTEMLVTVCSVTQVMNMNKRKLNAKDQRLKLFKTTFIRVIWSNEVLHPPTDS